AGASPAEIYASVAPSVARVEFEGEMYSGERETGTGSAFLISHQGLLLTCKHVVPVLTNYKSSVFRVRLGGISSEAVYDASVVWTGTGPEEDLALLRVNVTNSSALSVRSAVPIGTPIFVMGFPLNLDLNISEGLVSGRAGDGRYVM